MPTFLPSIYRNNPTVPEWEQWYIVLSRKNAVTRGFERLQTDTEGFVIAFWKKGVLTGYFNNIGSLYPWGTFGDDTVKEMPYIYITLTALLRRVNKLRTDDNGVDVNIGVVFWQHPEAYLKPREFGLITSDGNRFPGSPKQ